MSVYVDGLLEWALPEGAKRSYSGGGELWCHMIADTHLELVKMAQKLSLNYAWLQDEGEITEHFDLTPGKRAQAVREGAIELSHGDLARVLERKRET